MQPISFKSDRLLGDTTLRDCKVRKHGYVASHGPPDAGFFKDFVGTQPEEPGGWKAGVISTHPGLPAPAPAPNGTGKDADTKNAASAYAFPKIIGFASVRKG